MANVFDWYLNGFLNLMMVLCVTIIVNMIVVHIKYNRAIYPRDIYEKMQDVLDLCDEWTTFGTIMITVKGIVLWPIFMPYYAYVINERFLKCVRKPENERA